MSVRVRGEGRNLLASVPLMSLMSPLAQCPHLNVFLHDDLHTSSWLLFAQHPNKLSRKDPKILHSASPLSIASCGYHSGLSVKLY